MKASYSTVRLHRFALSYYFEGILKKHLDLSCVTTMRKGKHLPTILTRNEIVRILKQIHNIKHRLIIALLYSVGLRVSEVVNIRVGHVSMENLTLFVAGGKGNKERVTIFSESLRPSLEEFIEVRDGNEFLFTSEYQGRKQLHVRSVQMIFKQAIVKSGINKKASCPICVTAQSLSHPKNNYQV